MRLAICQPWIKAETSERFTSLSFGSRPKALHILSYESSNALIPSAGWVLSVTLRSRSLSCFMKPLGSGKRSLFQLTSQLVNNEHWM